MNNPKPAMRNNATGEIAPAHLPGTDTDGAIFRCQCGEWSGARCEWTGPIADTFEIHFTPVHLRASRIAANNYEISPSNGAIRIRVEESCGRRMIDSDHTWCRPDGEP